MRYLEIGESMLSPRNEHHFLGSIFSGIFGTIQQSTANHTNKRIAQSTNKFNAEEAQKQRDWQEKMVDESRKYNSPESMISRGLNPFMAASAIVTGSKSPASGGAVASAAGMPSLQAFRPDFSDLGSALASMAQARAAMLNAEQNAALTPYKMQQILGDTNYRNIGVGQSGYWTASTGRRSALLDQSKEYQELKNMEFAGRLTSAQEAQILLDSEAQQVLNKYLDEQQQADLFIKGQTLSNLYAQGSLTEAQYKTEMAKAVKTSAETNGIRISNKIAEQTADSLIYANIQSNRARGLSSLWDSKNTNVLKNIEYSKDKALRDYYKWSSKLKQKDVDTYELRNAVEYGTRIFQGAGNSIGAKSRKHTSGHEAHRGV